MTIPQSLTLQVQQTSERLDRYLSQHLPDLSRSRIQKLIEEGNVQINNQLCTSKKATIKIGDSITLTIPAPKPL
ncbi:MAG TPA: RluA family pseudouridine synthase, partial [Cyanobacteria bacterium UBA11148]|nr:RluA family pseudouridine synthase [Cyanobacteria bacterium UBA11148]